MEGGGSLARNLAPCMGLGKEPTTLQPNFLSCFQEVGEGVLTLVP